MVTYTNNQTVSVKVVQKGKISEITLAPGEEVEIDPNTEDVIAEDAP